MTGKQEAILIVAQNLRVAQAAAQVSNLELAKACGVSARTVGKWRRGEVEITLGHLAACAVKLGRPLAWFVAPDVFEDVA